jgi:hypothetical protein
VSATALAAGVDLRQVLNAERDRLTAAGWSCEPIGSSCGFFFASRDGERVYVATEGKDPRGEKCG